MLWLGVAVLLLSVGMAMYGRLSPGGFGLGRGLLVAWYLFERERPEPAATEEDLAALDDALHESSTEFDLSDLPMFLRRIVPYVTGGFGEREVAKLSTFAERLPHNRERQTEFQLVFRGEPIPLRVRLFKDDVSSIGVCFFTSHALAELLDREIVAFLEQRRM
jgi:hypothetical protein